MSLPYQFKKENSENILIYHYVEEMVADFSVYSLENYKDGDDFIRCRESVGIFFIQER